MKYILIIGDGMADNATDLLSGKTPLQHANIPMMDELASKGILGHVKNVPDGLPAGSDTAILSIFGCDPNACYTGRAPLEAAAAGIELSPGDAAYRCNMVTLEDGDMPFEEKRILSHSAGSIEGEQSIEFIKFLYADKGYLEMAQAAGMHVEPSPSFRHIAVQQAADIKGIVLIPPHDHLTEVIGPLLPTGCKNAKTLKKLMKKAHELLDKHPLNEKRRTEGKMPANGIWFWAEGTAVKLPSFTENYGKNGTVISAVPLCHGIGAQTGLSIKTVEGATGELDTNYAGKAQAAIDSLRGEYDFVAVHLEAPDECTHNGDLKGKIQAIENLDGLIIRPIVETLRNDGTDFRMLILSDHKTLTDTRGHDGTPVPFIIFDSRSDTGAGLGYSEENGEKGSYLNDGTKLMEMLFGK